MTNYAFDQELAPFVERMRPLDYADPVTARAELRAVMARQPEYVSSRPLEVTDVRLPSTAAGPGRSMRIYRPMRHSGRIPVVLFPHWGGFVSGDLDTSVTASARIADQVEAIVLSPDYRLAPEHPFPAALMDCHAALLWALDRAEEMRTDPERLAVGGMSAGGGLAAALALFLRDSGGPRPQFQFLLFPELDDRLTTESAHTFVDTPMLDRRNLVLSWQHYLGPTAGESDAVSPYAAPARAKDLTGLPPAFVGVCEFDPLRDEGIEYANRLHKAGVPTQLVSYPGTFHASIGLAHAVVSEKMVTDHIDALGAALSG